MSYESQWAGLIGRQFTFADVQREIQNRNVAYSQIAASATALVVGANPAMATAGGTITFVNDANGSWVNHATAATIDLIGGRTFGGVQFQHLPVHAYTIMTGSSIAQVRNWIGLGLGTINCAGDDPSTFGDFVGFRASSTASDVNWKFVTSDLANTAFVTLDTGVPWAASTRYNFVVIHQSTTQLYAFIGVGPDAVLQGPFPLTMPTGISTNTAYSLQAICENTAAAAKAIRVEKMWYSRR